MTDARTYAAQARTTSLRGRIPALSAAQAEAMRKLFASAVCWPLRDERMLCLAPPLSRKGMGGVFELEGEGSTLALRFDAAQTPRADVSLPWSDYSGRSRLLAWSLAHEAALVRLSEAIGVPLLPVAEVPADADITADADASWFGFTLEDMYEPPAGVLPQYTRGDMCLPLAWLERLLARAEPLDPDNPQPDLAAWLDLPLPVSVRCAGPMLPPAEWEQLRIGDVIVTGSRTHPPALQAQVNGRRWTLAAAAEGWRIDGEMQTIPTWMERSAMNEDTESPDEGVADDGGADDSALRSLPVLVEFELGRLELTVGELAALQPGYVFALPAYVEGSSVTIRANGRACGRGELVAVGDTLGVRLVSWS